MTLFKSTLIVAALSFCVPQSITKLFAEGGHSHDFPKEIMDFHHVMAPLWHMDKGIERTKLSCEATQKMLILTKDITNSQKLAKAVSKMQNACISKKTDIQKEFKSVHDAFHKISEQTKEI